MGFYVPTNRDVKFPKACEQCHFYDGLLCCVMDTYVHDPENKHEECPLIEIPDNHGRLIDADAAIEDIRGEILEHQMNGMKGTPFYIEDLRTMWQRLEDEELIPTIIPADEVV